MTQNQQNSSTVKSILCVREDEDNYYLGLSKKALNEPDHNPIAKLYNRVFQNEILFIILISLLQGLFHVQHLAIFTYKNNILKISSEIIQLMSGIISLPWSFKPVFGYLFDKIVVKLNSTKKLILFSYISRIAANSVFVQLQPGFALTYFSLFVLSMCKLIENITCEYLLVLHSKKQSKSKNRNQNFLPYFFGFRAFGSILGNFYGGRLLEAYGINYCFKLCIDLSVFMLIFTTFYKENFEVVQETKSKTFVQEFDTIVSLVFRDRVLQMIIVVCLINITPSYDAVTNSYMMDKLKLTKADMSDLWTIGSVFYVVALFLYQTYFKNFHAQTLFTVTNFVLWLINVSFMLIVAGYIKQIFGEVKGFCIITQGISSLIQELNFMPLIAIWCSICPDKLEATSITLFTGLMNISGNASNYFGSLVLYIFNVNQENFQNFWIPLLFQNVYLLVVTFAVLFIDFPNRENLGMLTETQEELAEVDHMWKQDNVLE